MTMTEAPQVAAPPTAQPADDSAKGKGKKKGKKDKGGRSNVVPALILASGIAAGGWFMGGSSGEAATTETTAVPDVVEGPLLDVEPMTVNLAGGRYLRLGVSVQLTDAYEDAVESEEGGEHFAPHDVTRVRDRLIANLGGRDAATLASAEGRAAVKDELAAELDELLDGAVMDVYFTEFVIQ